MNKQNLYRLPILFYCAFCAACTSHIIHNTVPELDNKQYLPTPNISVKITSLSYCTNASDSEIELNTSEPVTIIIHGCFSSAGLFRSLADAFAFHGQQAICFNYDDRDSLEKSSAEIIAAIEFLESILIEPNISVIGHSQGGLVA